MGNFPAKVTSYRHAMDGASVSTRSDPPNGYAVEKEIMLITANSKSFTRSSGEEQCMREVLAMACAECKRLNGNYVLGVHIEVKQFGDSGTWMVFSLTGMSCLVKKIAAVEC
jgi:hypothetical protein